jgi:hypothetical protein
MNKKYLMVGILLVFVLVAIYSFPVVVQTSEDNSKVSIHSSVCIYKNDELIGPCTHNTMMNAGLNWTRDAIGNAGTAGSMKNIAVGNTTTAETEQASLAGEIAECGLERAAGTYSVVGTGNWSISKLFTTTGCAGIIVNTTGLFNATSSGVMFAGKNFTNPVTLQIGDQLNVTWYVWVAGG